MIIERDAEVAALNTHLRAVVDGGRGRMVLVAGEAGIGKTTLVNEFVDGLGPRVPVLRGWCDPLETPRPLGPLVDILTASSELGDEHLTAALAGADPHALHQLVVNTLKGRCRICVIEDAHWADGATLDALGFLARRTDALPALLIVSYRDDGLVRKHPLKALLGDLAGQPGVHRLDMSPWSLATVTRVASGTGMNPPELHALTGGNPFFVTEVLAARSHGEYPETLPRSVVDAVGGRLHRLSTPALETTHAAAVCGSGVHLDLLAAVCASAPEALAECIEAGVLVPDGATVRFRHELIRQTALAQVDAYRRKLLHGRALTALARPPVQPEALAGLIHHAEHAGDGAAISEYGPAAADHAFALGANQQAASLYALCLGAAREAPSELKVTWTERHAVSAYLAGEPDIAVHAMRQAIAMRHDSADLQAEGDDQRWLSHALFSVGRSTEAAAAAAAAVTALRPLGPSRSLGLSLVNVAELAAMAFDPRCHRYAQDAITLATELGDDTVVVRARGYAALATMFTTDTGWEDLEAAWRDAMATPQLVAHGGVTGAVLAWTAVLHHRLDYAMSYIASTREHCDTYELPMFGVFLDAIASLASLHRGQWTDALDHADRVLTRPNSTALHRVLPLTCTALVHARRDQPGATTLLAEARADAEPNDLFRLGAVYAADAELAWLSGDDAAAHDAARQALHAAPAGTDPWITGRLQRWLRLTGAAPQNLESSTETQVFTPYHAEVSGDWRTAAEQWLRLGCPYDAALAGLGGDIHAVERARNTFHSLEASAAVRRADQRLRHLGATRARTEESSSAERLTKRERQVLALLAAGHSDAAISAALFISPKTVSRHVGSILAKLGVHNRTQAAVHALTQRPGS